jgi:hypothetical protein
MANQLYFTANQSSKSTLDAIRLEASNSTIFSHKTYPELDAVFVKTEASNSKVKRHTHRVQSNYDGTISARRWMFSVMLMLFFVLGVASTSIIANAQTIPGDPNIDVYLPCSVYQNGISFKATRYDYTPLLRTNMPIDVLMGYIGMDSIITDAGNSSTTSNQIREQIKNFSADNDTFRTALKYLYRVADYSPIYYYR